MAPRHEPTPTHRRLRVYAFDPSLSTSLEHAVVNQALLPVRWEQGLDPGPVGEYLEVVDYDPGSGCFYAPVDLNHGYLLAQDGLPPSEASPQFHQQMVYAVAMTTIEHFERALGRSALWSPRAAREIPAALRSGPDEDRWRFEFVRRLRIYPHALRQANAYYSPVKKALLFGYFPAAGAGDHFPGGRVFSCLSQDIIAHETSHALLDGMHRRLIERSNPDVLAFHEAFADIVALFQRFSMPDVLRSQIARTRGDLRRESLMGELALQFGMATGTGRALRSAIGRLDPQTGVWTEQPRDPRLLQDTLEPHDRGAILVAAVFDAFLNLYSSRTSDLLRIATGGSGMLPAGEVQPDMVQRLADEAAKVARHVLCMCIRALDYLPPVDPTFGEYLRALITADYDSVPDDRRRYRVAVIEAFRRRGIYPRNIRTLSQESLLWDGPQPDDADFLSPAKGELDPFHMARLPREEAYILSCRRAAQLHRWLMTQREQPGFARLGLDPTRPFEVHSLRLAERSGPNGPQEPCVVAVITQKRAGFLDEERQQAARDGDRGDFTFRGGCTLVLEAESFRIRYCIRKRLTSEARLRRQREYHRSGEAPSLRATYFGRRELQLHEEPFALVHASGYEEEP